MLPVNPYATLLETALAILQEAGNAPPSLSLRLSPGGGLSFSFELPPATTPSPARAAVPELTLCERDILAVLEAAERRISTAEILRRLEAAGKQHGDSTVQKALARLVRLGRTTASRRTPRGYAVFPLVPAADGRGGLSPGPPAPSPPSLAEAQRPPAEPLREIEENILEALGRATMYAREIAQRSGYRLNSYFRTILAGLCKPPKNRMELTMQGYRRIDLPGIPRKRTDAEHA